MIWFLLFLVGLCVGSFINCLVYRLNEGREGLKSFFKGRSFCDYCREQLVWYDNIPIISFLLLRGRCRDCKKPISLQYPLVELGTGVLTVVSFQLSVIRDSNLLPTAYCLLITYVLITIFVSDLRYGTIPDKVIYPSIGLAILFSVFSIQYSVFSILLTGFGAAGFFLTLVALTRGRGMGMGDVKLAGLMGLVLGWPKIVVALYLAFLTGALAGVILILLGKKRFGEHIPFGPFLTASTFVALFWGEKIWQSVASLL